MAYCRLNFTIWCFDLASCYMHKTFFCLKGGLNKFLCIFALYAWFFLAFHRICQLLPKFSNRQSWTKYIGTGSFLQIFSIKIFLSPLNKVMMVGDGFLLVLISSTLFSHRAAGEMFGQFLCKKLIFLVIFKPVLIILYKIVGRLLLHFFSKNLGCATFISLHFLKFWFAHFLLIFPPKWKQKVPTFFETFNLLLSECQCGCAIVRRNIH